MGGERRVEQLLTHLLVVNPAASSGRAVQANVVEQVNKLVGDSRKRRDCRM